MWFLSILEKTQLFILYCKKYSYICGIKRITMSRTVTASLGPHYEEFIQNSILCGRYNNASEVVRAGLRLLEEREKKMEYLRTAIQEGIDSGVCEDFDPEEHLKQLKSARRNG